MTIELSDEIKEGKLWKGEEREVLHLNTTKLFGDRWSGDITVNGKQIKVGHDRGRFGDPYDEGFEISLSV